MNTNSVFGISQTQIGITLYTVKTMPSERATETAAEKLVRFVNDSIIAYMKSLPPVR